MAGGAGIVPLTAIIAGPLPQVVATASDRKPADMPGVHLLQDLKTATEEAEKLAQESKQARKAAEELNKKSQAAWEAVEKMQAQNPGAVRSSLCRTSEPKSEGSIKSTRSHTVLHSESLSCCACRQAALAKHGEHCKAEQQQAA